jgi:hypothetical protein
MNLKGKSPGSRIKPRKLAKRIAVSLTLLVIAVAVVASIGMPRRSTHAAPKKYKATKPIILDQATGTVRNPTQEETDAMVAQIEPLTNRSTEDLQTVQTGNGAMMDLQGRFGGIVLGRATPDGTTEVRCVFTFEEALDFLGLEEDNQ